MTKDYFEVNFDGIPAPYHNYGGLAEGNIASRNHGGNVSHPKEAALQALEKAKFVADLGVAQAFLPPQLRPDFGYLRDIGNEGNDEEIFNDIVDDNPDLLVKLYSASVMWTANAATIAPSCDTKNSRLNIVPANLTSNLHRKIEAPQTHKILNHIFKNVGEVHPPLAEDYPDEGAANHMRLANGIHIFVYGEGSSKFPARQSLAASQKVAEALQIENAIFLMQNPDVIDAGVFHNDVIAVSNDNLILYHEEAFNGANIIFNSLKDIQFIKIKSSELSVDDAVKTYFFNSQIVTNPDGNMTVIAPQEVAEHDQAKALMEKHFDDVNYLNLKQSMRNGGGPACLRLRVMMNEAEKDIISKNANVFLNDSLYNDLRNWINKNYRDELRPNDLFRFSLYNETKQALAELSEIINIPIL